MTEVRTPPQAPHDLERRLATILCADVAGYSRMMGENEERTVRTFRGHREVFESLVSQHRGRIFNTAGDALLAEFSSAVEAVRCATDIQAALRTRNEHLPPEERMQFRIGLNLGDVILQGGDLLGDGVNVAARIQAATEPGGICISGSVHDQIQDKLSLEFRPLGEMTYKNIAKPVRTYTITEGAAVTQAPKRGGSRIVAIVATLGVLLAAGGWWAWTQVEAQREERARMAAQLAVQAKAAEAAKRAAEDAKLMAELQAQKQAADETLRRAHEERALVQQQIKELQAKPAASPAIATNAAAPAAYDGLFSGQICNVSGDKRQCWPVTLAVTRGVVEGSWLSRTNKTSTAQGTVSDGAIRLRLQAFTPKEVPTEALLLGRIADGTISATGKWNDGGMVIGEWHKGTFAASAAPTKGASRFDGRYEGELCNRPRDRPPHCFKLPITATNGRIEARWTSPTKYASMAEGIIAGDGSVTLTLKSANASNEPTEAKLTGRAKDGRIEAAGTWRGGLEIRGAWSRGT